MRKVSLSSSVFTGTSLVNYWASRSQLSLFKNFLYSKASFNLCSNWFSKEHESSNLRDAASEFVSFSSKL